MREAETRPKRRRRAWRGCAQEDRVSRVQPVGQVRCGFTAPAGMATWSALVTSARMVSEGTKAFLELI